MQLSIRGRKWVSRENRLHRAKSGMKVSRDVIIYSSIYSAIITFFLFLNLCFLVVNYDIDKIVT